VCIVCGINTVGLGMCTITQAEEIQTVVKRD